MPKMARIAKFGHQGVPYGWTKSSDMVLENLADTNQRHFYQNTLEDMLISLKEDLKWVEM